MSGRATASTKSFAASPGAASLAQSLTALSLHALGGGNCIFAILLASAFGIAIGCVSAALIAGFRIISIVVTIATFNALFGLLMFMTSGKSIYDLPDWWTDRVAVVSLGAGGALNLSVAAMVAAMAATWFLCSRPTPGRQLYACGHSPEAARRAGGATV